MDDHQPATVLVFGSINVDLVAEVDHIPCGGETVLASRGARYFGGKGGNQAVAAARARRSSDTRVMMAGAVGDDALGEDSLANLTANGVDTSLIQRSSEPTGLALITVDSHGENAITVISGANRVVAAAQVSDDQLGACAVLAMQLEIPLAEVIALAERARTRGVRSLVNVAPAPEASGESFTALMEAVHIAVFNEHELALTLQRLRLPSGDSHAASAAGLARRFGTIVVVTLGSEGALLVEADGTVHTVPGMAVEVVDTTGAGDTFVGVLAVTLAEGATPVEAAKRANRAAARACEVLGAQSGMPRAADIDRLT